MRSNEDILWDIWYTIKSNNVSNFGVQKEKRGRKG